MLCLFFLHRYFLERVICMSTVIHASIDERGKISGGQLGDQNGKEVCVRNWYSKPWQYCIRAKNSNLAILARDIARILVDNPNVGYDQSNRNSLYFSLKRHNFDPNKIEKCETDCSAFVTACYIAAGVTGLNYTSNAPTTSTMLKAFLSTGLFDVFSEDKYLKSDALLLPGDILLKPSSHVVMVNVVSNPYREPVSVLKKGNKGNIVKWLQWHLVRHGLLEWNEVDGSFGQITLNAVLRFQKLNNLEVDGLVGNKTKAVLKA